MTDHSSRSRRRSNAEYQRAHRARQKLKIEALKKAAASAAIAPSDAPITHGELRAGLAALIDASKALKKLAESGVAPGAPAAIPAPSTAPAAPAAPSGPPAAAELPDPATLEFKGAMGACDHAETRIQITQSGEKIRYQCKRCMAVTAFFPKPTNYVHPTE